MRMVQIWGIFLKTVPEKSGITKHLRARLLLHASPSCSHCNTVINSQALLQVHIYHFLSVLSEIVIDL